MDIKNTLTIVTNTKLTDPHKFKYLTTPTRPTPARPLEIIHIDSLSINHLKFLTRIDAFSKYTTAYPIKALSETIIVLNFEIM